MDNNINYNEEQTGNSNMVDNTGYNTSSALQIRLNTEPIIRQIEMYLRGTREEIDVDDKGQPIMQVKNIGESKANELGIQSIMQYIEAIFNPQVVQGNFTSEMYGAYLCRHRKAISTNIMVNLHRYNIKIEEYNGIISMIMSFIEAYISRLIDNKERDSYAQTIRSMESSSSNVRPSKGFMQALNPFGGRTPPSV